MTGGDARSDVLELEHDLYSLINYFSRKVISSMITK